MKAQQLIDFKPLIKDVRDPLFVRLGICSQGQSEATFKAEGRKIGHQGETRSKGMRRFVRFTGP